MSKISELGSILADNTQSRDLFVTVSLDLGANGTRNITRAELVKAIQREIFDAIRITGGSISGTDLILKNTNIEGNQPDVNDIRFGELYINTRDGKIFLKRGTSGNQEIVEISADGSLVLDGLADVVLDNLEPGQILEYNGENWVNVENSGGGLLGDIGDVSISDTTDYGGPHQDILWYNMYAEQWVNIPFSEFTETLGNSEFLSIRQLSDVDMPEGPEMPPYNGDLLVFNEGYWGAGEAATLFRLDNLRDIDLSNELEPGDFLQYDGSNWINVDPSEVGIGVSELDDLNDVDVGEPEPGDFLQYDGDNWVAATAISGYVGSRGYTGSAGNVGFTGSRGYTGSVGNVGFTSTLR